MAIPIGKLALYTAACGIHPALTLPVSLDVGTDNPALLADPLYLGYRAPRLRGPAYDALVEAFVDGRRRGLARLRHPVGGLQAAQRAAHPRPLPGPRAVVQRRHPGHRRGRRRPASWPGCAALGTGLARRARRAGRGGRRRDRHRPAAPPGDARRRAGRGRRRAGRIVLVDSRGLVHDRPRRPRRDEARAGAAGRRLRRYGFATEFPDLVETIERVRPTVLVGTTGVGGTFDRGGHPGDGRGAPTRPIVLPLSNPTSAAEATPGRRPALDRRAGHRRDRLAVRRRSSVDGRRHEIGQANNVFIFPGVGLGAIVAEARTITDRMFLLAARTLADAVTDERLASGALYPPVGDLRAVSRAIARRGRARGGRRRGGRDRHPTTDVDGARRRGDVVARLRPVHPGPCRAPSGGAAAEP